MPSSRRYFEEVWRVLERDRRIANIALLEMEIWPDDPEQWSQSTLDIKPPTTLTKDTNRG